MIMRKTFWWWNGRKGVNTLSAEQELEGLKKDFELKRLDRLFLEYSFYIGVIARFN